MDTKNKGITWDLYKRHPYAGIQITGQNKKAYFNQFLEDFLKSVDPEGRKDPKVLLQAAEVAKNRVNRETKHYRAWLKGKNTYKFKGETYHVMDQERFDRFKDTLIEMDRQAKEQALLEEEE